MLLILIIAHSFLRYTLFIADSAVIEDLIGRICSQVEKQRKKTNGSKQGCNLRVQLPALHMEILGLVWKLWVLFLWKAPFWGFPGGSLIKALSIHCRGRSFDLWWGTKILNAEWPKKKASILTLIQGQRYLREISLEAVSGSNTKVKTWTKSSTRIVIHSFNSLDYQL